MCPIPATWCYLLKRFPQLTQTFVATELRELERQGAQLAVVARGGPSGADPGDTDARRLSGLGAPVRHLSDEAAAAVAKDPAAADEELARHVRELGATHLHAHFAGWAGHAARRVAAMTGIGYSVTAHATDIYRAGVDESALVDLMADARFFVTVTEDNRVHLERLLTKHGRSGCVVRLYNGLDLDRLVRSSSPREQGLVVAAGRLVEKKGHDVLIEAVRRLRDGGRDLRCVVVGEGPLRGALQKQVADAGLTGTVELVGGRDHDAVLDLLRRAIVFALPSVIAADGDRDALPTVVLEAMALGTPVVSTTVSGIPEMVADGESGLLVGPRDPAATAAALARLLDEPDLRQRFADAARSRVEKHFDVRRNVAVLKGLFTQASGAASTPAFPDFPPLGDDALADADRVQAGRWLLVGEEYALGPAPDWTVNPSSDKEWQIAQHKHYWGVHLVHAAAVHDEPAYLESWSRLLTSWLDGMGSGHIAQSDAQVEAKRIESWVWAMSLLPAAPWQGTVDPALLDRLTARLGQEAAYVAAHLKPVRNHRTFELYAVALAAVLFPANDDALRDLAVRDLTANLFSDLGPDGVHIEMSTHYHQLVAETAVGFVELCTRNGIRLPGALLERVHEALRWSLWLQWPDASIPLLNDSDTGDHRDLLRRGSVLFDDPELLFGATLGAAGQPPPTRSRLFPASGYLVLSDGWGHDPATHAARQHVVLDTAALGEGSHSHYDLLSFTWYTDGGPVIVDPGRFTYSADPDADGHDWRHHFKSTAAHNTVTVDGLDQTRYVSRNKHGPEAALEDARHHIGGRTDWAAGTVRSQEYAPLHRRTLVFPDRSYLLVLDRLIRSDGAEHSYDLRLHLPDLAADLVQDNGFTRVTTPRAVLVTAAPSGARTELQRDWVSRRYGVKTPAAVLSTRTTAVDADLVTVLTRRSGVDVRRVDRTDLPGGLAVRVSGVDDGEPFDDVLLVGDEATEVSAHGVAFVGRWCLVRRDGRGRPVHLVGEAVPRLLVDGQPLDGATGAVPEWSA